MNTKELILRTIYQSLWGCVLFMAVILIATLLSCNGAAQTTKLPEWSNSDHTNGPIIFEFSCMDSCAYSWEDGCFLIWYDDADGWDLDALAYRSGRTKWYGEYILMDIEDSLVGEFLQDFHKYTELRKDYANNWKEMDKLSAKWAIYEYFQSDIHDYFFDVVKMEDPEWWFK